jgi:hypothetical protein
MSSKSTIAAIAGSVMLAAGLTFVLAGPRLAKDAPPPADAIAPAADTAPLATGPAPAPAAQAAPMDMAPPEMMEAKTTLKAEYAERRKALPEEIAKPIDDDIGVIEGIAADLLAALASEPENEDLKRMLVQTYRNEVKLLKKALHLSSEENDDLVDSEDDAPAEN